MLRTKISGRDFWCRASAAPRVTARDGKPKKNPTEAGLIVWRRLFAEFSENFVGDSFYRTDTFDAMITRSPGAARPVFVVRRQRFGLFVIDLQTLANCFFLVVDALDQRFAGNIVETFALRRFVGQVINATRCLVHATSADAAHNLFIVDDDFYHVVNHDQRFGQCVGLPNRARETIEQKTLVAIFLNQALLHETNDQLIGDETARIHDRLGFQTQLRARLYSGAQHVAGGNLRNTVALHDELGLRALARAGWAQQNDTHVTAPAVEGMAAQRGRRLPEGESPYTSDLYVSRARPVHRAPRLVVLDVVCRVYQ